MPDRAEGARAVLRLVEILGESWMDFANRQQSRAPSRFFRSGRGELPWGLGRVTVGVGESYRGGGGPFGVVSENGKNSTLRRATAFT